MGKTVKLTTKTFIEKAVKKHGQKYGYDRVDYVNSKTKVDILCEKCGKYFTQAPSKHLSGQGCPRSSCGGVGPYKHEDFIEAATKKHGDKYLYDKVSFQKMTDVVEIYCKECGVYFKQKAGGHLRGGCLKCSERENGLKRRMGLDEFKRRSKKTHGDRYKYDMVKLEKVRDKVQIFCTVCQKYFWQEAHSHMMGNGCPCNRGESLNNENFREKAKAVHGNKYNYDEVEVVNNRTKVKILCNNCGKHFMQSPARHLSGNGCPRSTCGGTQKLTHDEFIEKARAKYGDRYNYLEKYTTAKTKMRIKCTKCETVNFLSPNAHLASSKGGCPFCSPGSLSNKEDFLRKAEASHAAGHYCYDKFVYVDAKTKSLIFCNTHKEHFLSSPRNHLSSFKDGAVYRKGSGCPKCGRENSTKASSKPYDVFISQAREIHGDLYKYDIESYAGVKDKMNIYCKKHGLFKQDPDCHINGKQGCPICKSSHGEQTIKLFLENSNAKFKTQYKFDECKNKRSLPFDFAILNDESEVKGLIEFHGEQHYRYIKYFHRTYQGFINYQRNDQIKYDFCNHNNIPLLVIPYYEFDSINERTSKFLKSIKTKKPVSSLEEVAQINIFQY